MASARLRRHLEGADQRTLANAGESFCLVGTPLPALDPDASASRRRRDDANEFKPAWQQEVRDEQGRRRFHGAFTGGWSAGYYNTVGSKEGWTPTSFRSSRKDKQKAQDSGAADAARHDGAVVGGGAQGGRARPEDFMDEEDLEDARRGTRISSKEEYSLAAAEAEAASGATKDPLLELFGPPTAGAGPSAGGGARRGPELRPASSSLGTQLLQRMGWKPGQGLGPRVTLARRKLMLLSLGQGVEGEEEGDDEASRHLFAPPNTPLALTDAGKTDLRGLGHAATSSSVQTSRQTLEDALRRAREESGKADAAKPAAARSDRGGGFGISVLEQDSDGEDEVYAKAESIHDSTLAPANRRPAGKRARWDVEPPLRLGGAAPGQTDAQRASTDREGRPGDVERRPQAEDSKVWRDGRPLPPGFRVGKQPLDKEAWFRPPPVPKGWTPDASRVWARYEAAASTGQDKENRGPVANVSVRGPTAASLRPDDRASILGEARIPGPPPSLADYLSAKDRERMERAKAAGASVPPMPASAPPERDPSRPGGDGSDSHVEVPFTDAATASAALRGFMPFGNDPAKQSRYRRYLEFSASRSPVGGAADRGSAPSEASLRTPAAGQTADQLSQELREFAKSAAIFRPLSSAMASRFQSASSAAAAGEVAQPTPGLHVPTPKPKQAEQQGAGGAAKGSGADSRQGDGQTGEAEMPEETLTPAQTAARAEIFGAMTRQTHEWRPDRLFCKRLNVAAPASARGATKSGGAAEDGDEGLDGEEGGMARGHGAPGRRGKADVGVRANAGWEANKRQLQAMAEARAWETSGAWPSSSPHQGGGTEARDAGRDEADGEEKFSGEASMATPRSAEGAAASAQAAPPTLANVGLGEDEMQGRDTLTYVRPPMDVFKAVFASDEEDESDDEEAEKRDGEPPRGARVPTQPTNGEGAESLGQGAAEAPLGGGAPPASTGAPAQAKPISVADPTTAFRPTFVRPTHAAGAAPPKRKRGDGRGGETDEGERRRGQVVVDARDDDEGGGTLVVVVGGGSKSAEGRKKGKKAKAGDKSARAAERRGGAKGMLTFSIDGDEEGDEDPDVGRKDGAKGTGQIGAADAGRGAPTASRTSQGRSGGSTGLTRPRASDLF